MVDTGQNYLSSSEYRDTTQLISLPQYINKVQNTQYTGEVNNYQQTHNYLYNPQETLAANQTVISNAYTRFAQYPQPITSHSYQLQTNIHDIGEIIPSVNYNSNSNLGINGSQNSSSLLTSSQNSNQVSFADILLDHNSSNTSSGTLSASDLEVLSSCLQISQDGQLSSSEHSVNPEILLNRPQNSDMIYTHFEQTEVAANEDCVTSEMYEQASAPSRKQRVEDKRRTMKVSCQEEKAGRENKKSVIVWDDVTSLPEKISLPLPPYCDCENILIDTEEKIKQQSYIKNKKEIILRHVGRVVINDIELCSFVRNETAYISSGQLFSTGIFNKAAHQLFSSCGKSFPSFVDRLLIEEREYMKQKGFLSQTETKSALFSAGFVGWIIDYLNRDVNDKNRTIIYEKYLGHHCSKYKSLKSWQAPTPLPIPTRTYIRTKPKNKTTGSDMITTYLVRDGKTDKFTVAEIGRLMFSDKILAAFMLDDGREIVCVNFYQVVVYAPGVSFTEFYSLVKEFNCRLITSPDGVKNHFKALKQEVPVAFLESEWIKLSSFMQICSYLLGKLPHKHQAKVYFNQILKSKPREIFGHELKISLSKITFPETETGVVNSGDILSMAAASANIGTDFVQNSEVLIQPQLAHGSRKSISKSNDKGQNSQLELKKMVVTKAQNLKKRGRPPTQARFHLLKDSTESETKTCAVQTDLDCEDSCESVPNIDLTHIHVDDSIPAVSKVTASSHTNSTSVSKTVTQNDQNSITEVNSPVPKVQNTSISDIESKTFSTDVNCRPKTHVNEESGRSKYRDAATGSDQEMGSRMKVADAELSSAIETINNLDFLNDSFELDSSSPDKLRIDLSASRNGASTPSVSDTENISNGRKEHTIMSNSNVTVIANNTGEEIFECVPLFSLAELVQKDEGNMLNPYSPFKSAENTIPLNQLEENDYSESFNNQSPAKTQRNCLESFEDSYGPMKKNCMNSNADLKTLNQVILGEEPDWVLSPQKSSNTMASLFDTPKTSPQLDRSDPKTPRLQSLCQKFNKLEREATPNTSLHFFAEIASASEDIVENNSTLSKKKSRPTFPVKLLKHVSNVSSFLNRDLKLNKATLFKNKFMLNIKLKKTMLSLYRNLGTDSSLMESFQKLLKLTVLLLSKICTISELQRNLDLLKNHRNVSETQTVDSEELERDEEMEVTFTEIRSVPATKVNAKNDENVEKIESNLSKNTSNTLQNEEKASRVPMSQTNISEEVYVKDCSDKEKATLESNCIIIHQNILQETVSSPEKSSPSKYKSRKRKLRDIFPQNEDKELAGAILNHKQTSSDVEIHFPNSKKSKLVSDNSDKTDEGVENAPLAINLDKNRTESSKTSGENVKINSESTTMCNSEKYPALLQSLLNSCPIYSKPSLNTSILRKPEPKTFDVCVNTTTEKSSPLGECETPQPPSLPETNSSQTPQTQSMSKKSYSQGKCSNKTLREKCFPYQGKCVTSQTLSSLENNSQQETSEITQNGRLPEDKFPVVSGKRRRKKPAKFDEEFLSRPKPKAEKKQKKTFLDKYKQNGKFSHQSLIEKHSKPVKERKKKHNDIAMEELPTNEEIFVYIPPVYGANDNVIDNSTQIIPASKFRRRSNKIKDILKESDSERDKEETVLNSAKTSPEDIRPSYSVIDSNGKILPSPKPNNTNRKISMSSGASGNGEKYEIFQSC
ncbi:hypothetical protein LOTGIDRAFT_171161 [Lottia gigantea]|uniref:Uncharacterized protein n=1 Tax=Lottia gigantea TaxID=225164 RepID=V4B0N5_LOTGI|nr:hypothetical protein LOTGIDRAFT_171161 [Lottia gigantea]ESP03733.1 hypothetical protein LOTGIDRAFT_171161 [Lottia gigantea]